ncbi:TasA family protein [Halosimplex aquaticum]|uniref:TasA family protein n=1 Tax=Halosimplex aquaticum TaxID=3026162 RepID=A0ABD5YE13_9EURY|nr:TasA family protein [Halosimplex aquaticum]
MTDSSTRFTRRQILGSAAAIGSASAAAGAGTMAYFSDAESSTGNAVQTGTLALGFEGSAAFSFDTSLAPTEATSDSVTLVRSGSLSGSLDVDVSYAESDGAGNDQDVSPREVAENVEIRTLSYGGSDLRGQVDSASSPPTLHDLATNAHGSSESTQNDLVDLADPGTGTEFAIELYLTDVGDSFQSDGVSIDFVFHLNQNDSQ